MRTTLLTPYFTNRALTSTLWNEMDRFFDGFNSLPTSQVAYDERAFSPQCDITETEDHYLMSVDLPGLKKDDIKIDVVNNLLTVSGERKNQGLGEKSERYQRYERNYGFFKRSFTLPTSIESQKVEARYEDGVLEIYLPKTPTSKPRHIEVQSGKGGVFERLLGSKKDTQDTQ
ncbi:Hsp20/alpha crystallin family protein [Bdellovibrio sp. HCB337]|uniref:Hsp20/alpha crystallin family protein n=1 Tax=Bdellovibrio sp. HCB337 TaxID=3394358 RepID=UPI0039A46354